MSKQVGENKEPRFVLCFIMLFLFSVAALLFADIKLAVVETVVSVIVFIIFVVGENSRTRKMRKYIEATMAEINQASKESTLNFPMATAVVDVDSNEIIWVNSAFENMVGELDHIFEKRLFDIIPEFDILWAAEGKNECPTEVKINDKTYRIYGSIFRREENEEGGALLTLYWLDVSEYSDSIEEFNLSRQIVSVIMIDNYEEIMNGLNDSERSTIIAEVDKRLLHEVRAR